MQNNPTLSFDANEPLYNADFDELANATSFSRVFVGRQSIHQVNQWRLKIADWVMVFVIDYI